MISFIIALFLVAIIYLFGIRNFSYWKKRGVKYDKPLPLFGNYAKVYLMQRSVAQKYSEIYNSYPNEKVVGFFRSSYPELILRDPNIVKRILVTDFSYFHSRNIIPITESTEPLLRHLFNADGDLWRLLRQRLTPAFTSGKLKAMFPLIVERAERLHTRIQAAAGAPIDARDLMARFTTDFIGACVFGLDTDALNDDDSQFRKLGREIININFTNAITFFVKQLYPNMVKSVRFSSQLETEMKSLVKSILKKRNYKPTGRNDFVDLLLECKQKGLMVGQSIEHFKPDGTPENAVLEMTDDLIAAQMFVFFIAGFETSSITTSFTLHQLAYSPDKQAKVQEEIDHVLHKYGNKLCYDAIKDMHYLEWAFKESMRMFPSLGYLVRECVSKYKFPDLDFTIDKGIKIVIPVAAMQNDPEIFANPEQFRPERFDPQELDIEKTKFAYLPFGEGPRACIGERLGLMQSMAGLSAVLSSFTVEPASSSLRQPVADTGPGIIQTISRGLPLMFRERKRK